MTDTRHNPGPKVDSKTSSKPLAFQECSSDRFRKLLARMTLRTETAGLSFIQPEENWFPDANDDEAAALSLFEYIEPKKNLTDIEAAALDAGKRKKFHEHIYKLETKKGIVKVNAILHYSLEAVKVVTPSSNILDKLLAKEVNIDLINKALTACESVLPDGIPGDTPIEKSYYKILKSLPDNVIGQVEKLEKRQKALVIHYKILMDDIPAFVGRDKEGWEELNRLKKEFTACSILKGTKHIAELISYLEKRSYVFRHFSVLESGVPPSYLPVSQMSATSTSSSSSSSQESVATITQAGPPGGPELRSEDSKSLSRDEARGIPLFWTDPDDSFRKAYAYIIKGDFKKDKFPFPKVTYDNYLVAISFYKTIDEMLQGKKDPCVCRDFVFHDSFGPYRVISSNRVGYYARRVGFAPQSVPSQFLTWLIENRIDLAKTAFEDCQENRHMVVRIKEFGNIMDSCPEKLHEQLISLSVRLYPEDIRSSLLQFYSWKIDAIDSDDERAGEELRRLQSNIQSLSLLPDKPIDVYCRLTDRSVKIGKTVLLYRISDKRSQLSKKQTSSPSEAKDLLKSHRILLKEIEKQQIVAVDANFYPKETNNNQKFIILFINEIAVIYDGVLEKIPHVKWQNRKNFPLFPDYLYNQYSFAIGPVFHYLLLPATSDNLFENIVKAPELRGVINFELNQVEKFLFDNSKFSGLASKDKIHVLNVYARIFDITYNYDKEYFKTSDRAKRQQFLTDYYTAKIDAIDTEDNGSKAALDTLELRISISKTLDSTEVSNIGVLKQRLLSYIAVKNGLLRKGIDTPTLEVDETQHDAHQSIPEPLAPPASEDDSLSAVPPVNPDSHECGQLLYRPKMSKIEPVADCLPEDEQGAEEDELPLPPDSEYQSELEDEFPPPLDEAPMDSENSSVANLLIKQGQFKQASVNLVTTSFISSAWFSPEPGN